MEMVTDNSHSKLEVRKSKVTVTRLYNNEIENVPHNFQMNVHTNYYTNCKSTRTMSTQSSFGGSYCNKYPKA